MAKYHFLTIELVDQRLNLVVEIPEEKLAAFPHREPGLNRRAQDRLAFDIACTVLRQHHDTNVASQIHNREIHHPSFADSYSPTEILARDGSKGWMLTPPRPKPYSTAPPGRGAPRKLSRAGVG